MKAMRETTIRIRLYVVKAKYEDFTHEGIQRFILSVYIRSEL